MPEFSTSPRFQRIHHRPASEGIEVQVVRADERLFVSFVAFCGQAWSPPATGAHRIEKTKGPRLVPGHGSPRLCAFADFCRAVVGAKAAARSDPGQGLPTEPPESYQLLRIHRRSEPPT